MTCIVTVLQLYIIAKNSVYHEWAERVEVDCHFIKDKVVKKRIRLAYEKTDDELADFLTKAVAEKLVSDVLSKLGVVNVYAPAWGWVLRNMVGVFCKYRISKDCLLFWLVRRDFFKTQKIQ